MSVESTENIVTSVVVTDSNREELERLYGKIPPADELSEAPRTHSFEEARERKSDRYNEAEEAGVDEISEQNI